MSQWQWIDNEQAMQALGAQVGQCFLHGGLITLHGDLGVGKTTLVRGLLRARGYTGTVKSPTYTLVEPYHIDGKDIFHFDLYRLADPEELEYMGMRDYLNPNNLCLIEWPEKAANLLPPANLRIFIEHAGAARRVLLSD